MADDQFNIKIGEHQSIEELTGGRIQKFEDEGRERAPMREPGRDDDSGGDLAYDVEAVAEKRGDQPDDEDYEAARQGYKPGMEPEKAKEKGIDQRTFVSQEIEHHMEDLGFKQDRAVAAALREAREAGYDVPPRDEKED